MGNIPDANMRPNDAKFVHYDANIVHYDAKVVQYDAKFVQDDAIFVPNETTDFTDYADFRIDFCHRGHRVPQRVRKKLIPSDAEDTDFGLLYLIFNFGYYSMCYMNFKQKKELTTKNTNKHELFLDGINGIY